MTGAEQRERAGLARRRVMLALRDGPQTIDQVRTHLKGLGRYGSPPGCDAFLKSLAAAGAIVSLRCRQRPTGPLVDTYRLPTGVCASCGCDDGNACLDEFGDPCHWVRPDLCSACAPETKADARRE